MAKKNTTTPNPAAELVGAGDVSFSFVNREGGPERLVCEAELIFNSGLLAGMKLVGFCLWKSPEGEIYVTFPSRAFGAGHERRYFDYLRSVEGSAEKVKALKAAVLQAYRSQGLDASEPTPSS